MSYQVLYDQNVWGGYALDPSDRWSEREDETYSIKITGISCTTSQGNVDAVEDIQPGETCFLVVVEYESGDTFGRTLGLKDFFWVTKDHRIAMDIKLAIENANEKNDWNTPYDVEQGSYRNALLKAGVDKQYFPWTGYFERLTSVDIIPLYMQ